MLVETQPANAAAKLGRGMPHARSHAATLPPTLATLSELQRRVLYVVSLEFALGNLDQLRAPAHDRPEKRSA